MLFEHGDAHALATRIEALMGDHLARRETADALRRHLLLHFSNASVVRRTLDAYAALATSAGEPVVARAS